MNNLDKTWCYLAGFIEANVKDCMSWRKEMITKCEGLGINFIDPCSKPVGLQPEISEEVHHTFTLRKEQRWDELTEVMRKIVREDHRCVDLSDFIVVYIDPDVPTCGTHYEVQSALTQKKPYFFICPKGKSRMPGWLFGITDHNYYFESVDEVVQELVKLNRGETPMSDRWVLLRKHVYADQS